MIFKNINIIYITIIFWILYNIICYIHIKYKYNMKFNLKYNIPLLIYALVTGKKIYYCKQDLNKTTIGLLSNSQRSIISEWKIGIHPFKKMYTTPSTNNYEYHKESIIILIPILKKLKNNSREKINNLIDKSLKNNIIDIKCITELFIRICDINNHLNDNEISNFSDIGYKVMDYINYKNSIYTLFIFILGFNISKNRKILSKQNDIVHRMYMDKKLFNIHDNVKYEDIPNKKILISMSFYNGMLFSGINIITAILLNLLKINKIRNEKLINDKFYRKEFIKEIIRIYSSLPTIPRKVDNFDIIFTDINKPISYNFNWDLFDIEYKNERDFNSFGFGKRKCIANGIIEEIYEQILLSIITRYNIELQNIKYKKNNVKSMLAYEINPIFKLHKK